MIVQVYARLDAALVKELRRRALELDINQPTAVAQAIEQRLNQSKVLHDLPMQSIAA